MQEIDLIEFIIKIVDSFIIVVAAQKHKKTISLLYDELQIYNERANTLFAERSMR